MDRHIVGDTVRIGNTFSVDDVNTDPTTVTLLVTDPSGNTEGTYTYAGSTITKTATGVYHKDLTVDEAGLWTVKWTGTGTAADIVTRTFTVAAQAVESLDVLTYDEAAAPLKIGVEDISNSARLQQAITAVSRAMDDRFGPIVKRTITAEEHHDVYRSQFWTRFRPIYSTPAVTLTEYDTSGTAQVISPEDHDTKPSYGYRLERHEGLGGGYSGRIWRRSSGTPACFADTVVVTYDAGRYSSTATVDPVLKEAASVTLINWWQQVLTQQPQTGVELDLPGYRFPSFAIPKAALDIVPRTEHQMRFGVA